MAYILYNVYNVNIGFVHQRWCNTTLGLTSPGYWSVSVNITRLLVSVGQHFAAHETAADLAELASVNSIH